MKAMQKLKFEGVAQESYRLLAEGQQFYPGVRTGHCMKGHLRFSSIQNQLDVPK